MMPSSNRQLFFKVWLLLHSYQLLMPALGVQKTKSFLLKLPFAHTHSGTPDQAIQDHLFALYLSRKYSLFEAKCLARSLTLWQMLQYQHLPASVKIGVRMENNAFKAHAWVELEGKVLNDTSSAVSAYSQISSLV